jgi:hypothetical protein
VPDEEEVEEIDEEEVDETDEEEVDETCEEEVDETDETMGPSVTSFVLEFWAFEYDAFPPRA